jgi:predicted dehydrogenase/spore coat polysaccharide biosynthesis protein SpsF (cytidylyltransferase family)
MKLLLEIEGRPIFAHMIDRLKLAKRVDQIIICTSTNPQDDPLEAIAEQEGIACFRGDEDDVVKRLSDAAVKYQLDYVLHITADCPFADPEYSDKIVEAFEKTGADFIRSLDLPHGAFIYGVNPAAFLKILEIKEDSDTEVWGRYFTDTDLFTVYDLRIDNPLHHQPELRMTLDYPEDLEFFRTVFAALYRPPAIFSLDEILLFLREHPEVVKINEHREADYLKRWSRQSWIKLKQRYNVETAVVVGAGSIGQRHIRNLQQLGIQKIVALRSNASAKPLDASLNVIESLSVSDLVEHKPDVAIISNPTNLHLESIQQVLPHVRGVFIEKPLGASLVGVAELLAEVKRHRTVTFIGYNLQFHPAVRKIREALDAGRIGSPLVFQGQVGQWLPDWHPNEDHKQSYAARKELGGGVTLTLSHEIHLALELFGPVRKVFCVQPTSAHLDVDVDVIADLTLQHANGAISQLHLDMLQKPANRIGVISGTLGSIAYDLIRNVVTLQTAEQRETLWSDENYDPNQSYVDQMQTFLNCVREGRVKHEHDIFKGAASLAIIEAAFASADSGCSEVVKA